MKHAVALVPGFLGFDHSDELTYFADRFIAGLRATVETRAFGSVLVVPVSVSPIGSLKQRQDDLLSRLKRLDASEPHAWHLVGHSTGGLDSALLLREHALAYAADKGSFFSSTPLDPPDIRSVTSIATPHYGTTITLAPVPAGTAAGASFDERLAWLAGLPELALDMVQRDELISRIKFGHAAAGRTSLDFFHHLLFGDKLLRDLRPENTLPLTLAPKAPRHAATPVFSIATLAPSPTAETTQDELFALLWRWTQLKASSVAAAPPIAAEPSKIVAARGSQVPQPVRGIHADASDGVVNTNRQVYGSFAGLVLADHCDVLGRYRRTDPFDGLTLDPGLLTSGAAFGDDEFFEMLRLIADGIWSVMGA